MMVRRIAVAGPSSLAAIVKLIQECGVEGRSDTRRLIHTSVSDPAP